MTFVVSRRSINVEEIAADMPASQASYPEHDSHSKGSPNLNVIDGKQKESAMIVVRIELHSAVTGKVKEIGTAIIDNVGGSNKCANYRVRVGHKTSAGDLHSIVRNPQRQGEVQNYPRISYNVWRLVSRAIRSAFPEEH